MSDVPPPYGSAKGAPKKILLIDTDEFLVKVYRHKLKAGGFEVTVMTEPADALAAIRSGEFDLVLTELLLGDDDGFELLQALRKDPETRGRSRVVAFTQLGGKEDAETARRLGAEDVWVKSQTTPHEVIIRIKELLARSPNRN